MNRKLIGFLIMTLVLSVAGLSMAKGVEGKKSPLSKTLGEPVYTKFNINKISTWIKNDGETDINQNGNSGLVYPKGSGKTAVFQSGFLWGGRVDNQFRVGGSVYRQGTVPGGLKYSAAGKNTISPDDADVRIYRVRRDYATGSMASELADGDGTTDQEIRDAYAKDWNEWPATQGAPYEDVNGDGRFDPTVDIPGVPGADQTIWFVCNDADAAQTDFMYGSLPMGIEEQVTVWGYASTGPLGNMLFRKFTIVNKNFDKKAFTEMYVSWWSDVDLGGASDDFAGCDTTLSLAYTYNGTANDEQYGTTPPVTGFDFFQGPLVPGTATDVGRTKGKLITGKKNLPMTAHYFFINGDNVYTDPPQGKYEGTQQWYNLFRGRVTTTGQQFVDPTTGKTTSFALYGDPTKTPATGWVDGKLHAPGDRRQGMASGPFNMAYGDTQEVVVAEMVAGAKTGINNLAAVTLCKTYDAIAQAAYDDFFVLPSAPKQPKVSVSNLDRKVLLNWSDATTAKETEAYSKKGYTFQGYNIYQLAGNVATLDGAVKIATFDVVDGVKSIVEAALDPKTGADITEVTQSGTDSGIERSIVIEKDYQSNKPLNNGSRYFYCVTSYCYNPDPLSVPQTLENSVIPIMVQPETPAPGVVFNAKVGDQVKATHSSGTGDGSVTAYVVDPSKVTGASYKVTFEDDGHGAFVWNLIKGTTTVLAKQTNQTGDADYFIVDGLQVKVLGPPVGLKPEADNGLVVVAGSRRHTQLTGDGYALEGWRGVMGYETPANFFYGSPFVVKASELKNIQIKLAKVDDIPADDFNPKFIDTDANMSYGYRYIRGASSGTAAVAKFAPYIVKTASYGYCDYKLSVPLSVWNVDNPASPKRLAVGFLENNVAGGSVDGKHWPAYYANLQTAGLDNYGTAGPREWLFVMDDPYTAATPDAKYQDNVATADANMRVMYMFLWARRDNTPWLGTEVYQVNANKINTSADVYTFTAPSVTNSADLAAQDVEKINVFPNPYYGTHAQEINKYQRFVTFNHLPQNATIRIFNLAGQLVRVIQKTDAGQFQRWDLKNDTNLPVASGLYIVHVDMPDLGKSKILKVAIIQEQQFLDRF